MVVFAHSFELNRYSEKIILLYAENKKVNIYSLDKCRISFRLIIHLKKTKTQTQTQKEANLNNCI